jgi:hypothetical protein
LQLQHQDEQIASAASRESEGRDEGTREVDVGNDVEGRDQEEQIPLKTMQDWDGDEPLDIDEMLDNDEQQPPQDSSLLDPLADHELTHISNTVHDMLDLAVDEEEMFDEVQSEYGQSDAGDDVDLYAQRVAAQQPEEDQKD